jgi:hypothetical protein
VEKEPDPKFPLASSFPNIKFFDLISQRLSSGAEVSNGVDSMLDMAEMLAYRGDSERSPEFIGSGLYALTGLFESLGSGTEVE